ncbi:MAG: O-antigen ligase family protein [Actinomycetota bacterium]|nr:O-antigen ligase family protein [Actinomycetota bacterium]
MIAAPRVGLSDAAVLGVNCMVVGAVWADAVLPLAVFALLMPLAVGLTRRPQRGLLVLAALVPFDGLLLLVPRLPPPAAGWKEALVVATLGATFVAPAGARAATGRRLPDWVPAVAGMVALGLVSALVVGGLQAAWGLKISFFFLLVAIVVWRCPLSRRERDAVVTILMATGFVTAVYGLAQQALGTSGLAALGYQYNSTIRTTRGLLRSFSSFDNPFAFGFFLMLVVLIGVPHALARPDRLRSRLFLLALPVFVGALASTFVRGAWVGLVVGLAYLGWARFPRLLLGLPLVLVGVLLLPSAVSSAAFSSSSGAQRVAGWQANLSEVTRHPLGLGLGSSNAAAEKVAGTGPQRDGVYHPDNEYYRAVYELGVLGLWFTVLLYASAFLSVRAGGADRDSEDGLFALAVSSTVLAAAAASVVATYLDTFPNNVYFWLLLAVVATQGLPSDDAARAVGRGAPARR